MKSEHLTRCAARPRRAVIALGLAVALWSGGSLAAAGQTRVADISSLIQPDTTCSGNGTFDYAGYLAYHFANQGVEGDLDGENLGVASVSTEHALQYVSAQNKSDSKAGFGYDWLQAGYGVGHVDAAQTSTEEVYEESSDLNSSGGNGPVAHFYADPLGNNLFVVYNTGQSGYGGTRDLYEAWEYSGSTAYGLGSSWQLTPKSDQLLAQIEGDNFASGSQACPSVGDALFGTNGQDGQAGDTMHVYNDSSTWVAWTPTNVPSTTTHLNSPPYNLATTTQYDVFRAWGS